MILNTIEKLAKLCGMPSPPPRHRIWMLLTIAGQAVILIAYLLLLLIFTTLA